MLKKNDSYWVESFKSVFETDSETSSREFLLVFSASGEKSLPWWLRWAGGALFHVDICFEAHSSYYVWLSTTLWGLNVSLFDGEKYPTLELLWQALKEPGEAGLLVERIFTPWKRPSFSLNGWMPFNCVQLVRYVLGLEERFFTGKQLYHFLLKRGAKPLS